MWADNCTFCFWVRGVEFLCWRGLILIWDVCFRNVFVHRVQEETGQSLTSLMLSTGRNGRRKAMRDSLVPAILENMDVAGIDA